MAAEKTAKIRFEQTNSAKKQYKVQQTIMEESVKGKRTFKPIVESLPMRFVMIHEEEREIPAADLKKLIAHGVIRSKEQMKERNDLIVKKVPREKMSDDQRNLVLLDRPYEV